MLLFLNIEGVLHPVNAVTEQFSRLHLLEDTLLHAPNVAVVISSPWKQVESLRALRRHFPPEIANRIIAVTPSLPKERYWRYREITLWLRQAGFEQESWIALDSDRTQFPSRCKHVFLTDPRIGLDTKTNTKLGAFFAARSDEPRPIFDPLSIDIDLDIALRMLDALQLKEGDLGAAYWQKVADLLKDAERFKERALAAEDKLRRLGC
ncbi:MAG: hypothetical protein GY734_07770 [Herbaspirillum sp.]|jgi:hypothetical protein|uniref:HAD domain-containing protein n=1 Tax=Herbaspirillum sp. TaxID=1890675 RepID=UPI00258868CA|nr:HAD domain-containing protein [Herbaspirillum sp.]MCP3656805.1 hypothetical protein [Herbaspirillum sp.]MCP3950591.1 hypothetical protein [Herbaspirillum sp.]MCP4031126.1 hypothetical protein [Herbaspirillum sp.]